MRNGVGFWDIVMITGALLILFWAALKILGVINSPVWIEMIPYIGGGLALLGSAYKFGRIMQGIENTERKVNRIIVIENKFNRLENEHNLVMNGKLKIKH